MNIINIDSVVERMYNSVKDHYVGDGKFCRTTLDGKRNPNAYGCADAANILYTLNKMPLDSKQHEQIVKGIQSFQNPENGLFEEGTHHPVHTTAHCVAALELFDARPVYPLYELEKYENFENVKSIFNDVDWLHCGKAAHPGAGVYAALVITERVGADWKRKYFDFLDANCDKETGVWVNQPTAEYFTRYFQIGDAFHYYFNYEHNRHPMPYPEALIDTCLSAYRDGDMGEIFEKCHGFIQMDWVYCLNRATRQTTHRFDEVKQTLFEFAKKYIAFLETATSDIDKSGDDLHLVFGTICCLAELQQALPGKIYSSVPLRLVLDRRPFI